MIKVNKRKMIDMFMSDDEKKNFIAKYWMLKLDYEKDLYKHGSNSDKPFPSQMDKLLLEMLMIAKTNDIDLMSVIKEEYEAEKSVTIIAKTNQAIVYDEDTGLRYIEYIDVRRFKHFNNCVLFTLNNNEQMLIKDGCYIKLKNVNHDESSVANFTAVVYTPGVGLETHRNVKWNRYNLDSIELVLPNGDKQTVDDNHVIFVNTSMVTFVTEKEVLKHD